MVGSDQMNENKLFNGRFFAPKEIRLKVMPETILNVSVDSLEEYSPVSFNFFNWKKYACGMALVLFMNCLVMPQCLFSLWISL